MSNDAFVSCHKDKMAGLWQGTESYSSSGHRVPKNLAGDGYPRRLSGPAGLRKNGNHRRDYHDGSGGSSAMGIGSGCEHPTPKRHKVKVNDRYARLGAQLKNNDRNIIRIAPMRGSDFPEGLLSKKIDVVKGWIKNTLGQAKLNPLPKDFKVVHGMERPHVGNSFGVLRVKFDFDENMWDDEVMWDIRYLLMGSKLGILSGFPLELRNVQDKLYISRDGISERRRREGGK